MRKGTSTAVNVVAGIGMLFASGLMVWTAFVAPMWRAWVQERKVLRADPVSVDGAATLGNAEATVTMVLYSDFQCRFCGRFSTVTLNRLRERYVSTGELRVVFKHAPADDIHPVARRVAEAAECAGRQGRFWPMHDGLFRLRGAVNRESVSGLVTDLGLDRQVFDRCMQNESPDVVRRHLSEARLLGLLSTPSVVFGSTTSSGEVKLDGVLVGAQEYVAFEREIERRLAHIRSQ